MATNNNGSFRVLRLTAVALVMAAAVAVLPGSLEAQRAERRDRNDARRFYPDDPLWQDDDRRDIAPVAKVELSATYDLFENTFSNPARSRGAALNVNTLGEVPDSSWFTNRIGRGTMTIEELLRGPATIDGPAPGPWTVIGRPGAGITPKFTIRDENGNTFVIKLDPPGARELASSVELIGTKIFHAIGYNVPEDFIASLDPSQLRIEPGTKIKGKHGTGRALLMSDVNLWLAGQPRQPDGTIRVLASRWVPGQVVGNFKYVGTRSDDANDIYPHERRRELRGLKVFAAWLNHDDARSLNTIDTYVTENGRRYLKHYLQDFGSTLGSGSTSAQKPRAGNEYYVEGKQIGKGLLGLGLWQRGWTGVEFPDMPSVGNIEANYFDPSRWKTEYPHPAFEQMDAADAFWAAGIASRFTDEMIRAVVASAQLSDPQAASYLGDVIIRRRDKVVAYWTSTTNPLDRFEAQRASDGVDLQFDNAADRLRLSFSASTYLVKFAALDNMTGAESAAGEVAAIEGRVRIPAASWGPSDAAGHRFAVVTIRTVNDAAPQWMAPVRVTVRDASGQIDIVAIDRPLAGKAGARRGTN